LRVSGNTVVCGRGHGGLFEKGKRYAITLEAPTTPWQRDRAKAALVVPSVAEIRWHDLRAGPSVLACWERPDP
jgi:hypothetical protein